MIHTNIIESFNDLLLCLLVFWKYITTSLMAQMVVCLQCRSYRRLGFDPWVGKDLLEEGMPIHSSFHAWRIPWTEEPGGLQPIGLQRVRHVWNDSTALDIIWIITLVLCTIGTFTHHFPALSLLKVMNDTSNSFQSEKC